MRRACVWGVVLVAFSAIFGCESIAGIEDRRYEAPVSGSPECEAYCNQMERACTGANEQYADRANCILTCEALPRTGQTQASNGVECRTAQAKLAESTGEPSIHCPAAGPFGKGNCGTTCEAYCELSSKICPDNLTGVVDCVASCAALKQTGVYTLSQLTSGDTLECRVAAVSRAALDPTECENAAFPPRTSDCADDPSTPGNCSDYCRVVMAACTGDFAVYESAAQCQAVCAALPAGVLSDDGTADGVSEHNTVGCRIYHSYSSIAAPGTHCPHAGPGGDGHCGKDEGPGATDPKANCEAYCGLAQAACAAEFSAKFADQAACKAECNALAGAKADSLYAVSKAGNSELACRLLHVARALEGTAGTCDVALGTAACPLP